MEQIIGTGSELVKQYVLPWSINSVFAILIFFVGRFLGRVITNAIKRLMERAKVDKSLSDFLGNIISVALTVVVVIAALEQLGVNTTSVMAIFAAAGLTVGLAMKDSLSNFASGVMIILFKPFKLGDVITAAGVTGVVESIRIFNTLMRTGDNQEITVPNSQIFNGTITNMTARDTRRIDMVIGIAYEDNIGEAKRIIGEILGKESKILPDPEPTILVLELGESSIDLAVRPWVKKEDYWKVRSDLLQAIKETFDQNGISIPYPQRDIHLKSKIWLAQDALNYQE